MVDALVREGVQEVVVIAFDAVMWAALAIQAGLVAWNAPVNRRLTVEPLRAELLTGSGSRTDLVEVLTLPTFLTIIQIRTSFKI